MPVVRTRSILTAICLLAGTLFPSISRAAELEDATTIRALSRSEADSNLPVRLEATVLYFNPTRRSDLVVHDGLDGVFVGKIDSTTQFIPGQRIRLRGRTYWGDHFPMVSATQVEMLGEGAIPTPRDTTYERISSGREIGQWVRLSGIVREAHVDQQQIPPRLLISIATSGGRFRVWMLNYTGVDIERLVDAEVSITGVPFALSNNNGRIFGFRILVTDQSDLAVIREPLTDSKSIPATALREFRTIRPDAPVGHRVRVTGTVSGWRPGSWLAIADTTAFLMVRTNQRNVSVTPGDVVEVIGFPGVGEYGAVIEDASFRATGERRPVPRAYHVNPFRALMYDSRLVTLDGTVLGRSQRADAVILTLESENALFDASLGTDGPENDLLKVEAGSRVKVTGICTVSAGDDIRYLERLIPQSFRLSLRDASDVEIVETPPWLTTRRAQIIIVSLFAVGLGLIVHQRQLHREVAARIDAEKELQQAHDELELRVEERSREIEKVISAKREAEGALRERTRLAAEIHDSLQQGLTALGAQLAVARESVHSQPATAQMSLDQARALVRYNQEEMRRTVWNLRAPRPAVDRTLASAFRELGNQTVAGSGIVFEVQQNGACFNLPELIHDHLLRIGQEALINAVKHAHATAINIAVTYAEPAVTLRVTDNGCGFHPESVNGEAQGHFGLCSMRERAHRLGSTLELQSQAGSGTSISITVTTDAGLAMCD